MSIFSFISDLIKPVTGVIDDLHTSGEEKRSLHNELLRIENAFTSRVLEYEQKMAKMKADIIMAEAGGESWLQRSWRPVTMLVFLILVCCHYFGVLAMPLANDMWDLLKIGIGGYIASRGAEKIVPQITDKLRANKE